MSIKRNIKEKMSKAVTVKICKACGWALAEVNRQQTCGNCGASNTMSVVMGTNEFLGLINTYGHPHTSGFFATKAVMLEYLL